MYNATSNSWTTYPTGLGQARGNLAAASLESGLVFFAGGLGVDDLVLVLLLRQALFVLLWLVGGGRACDDF